MWPVQNRELLYKLGGHRWQIHDLAFRSDDQMLVSVADEVRFWTLGPRKWPSWSGPKRRASCTRVLPIPRNADKTEVVSFPDGQMLLVHASSAELWKPNLERISRFDIPEDFRRHWRVDVGEGILFVEMWKGICAFDIYTGELLQAYTLPISFPDSPLKEEMMKQFQPAASSSLWRGPGGPYIHVGDGPRGWVTSLRLSGDGRFLLIPGVKKAAVVDVSGESKVVGTFPFNGQLRDSCILEDRVLAVNTEGRVFRWENLELAAR